MTQDVVADGERLSPARRRAIQAVACSGVVVVMAAVASSFVAAPQIGRGLHASQIELQWIVDSYTVVLAALLLFAGALGDRFGREGAFLLGLAIFGGASLVAGEAPSATVLIGARVGMGIGAALLLPVTLSLMTTYFPVEHRSRAATAWAVSFAVGGLTGGALAGTLLSLWWWGSLFLFNTGFSAVCLLVAIPVLPHMAKKTSVPLDPGGFALATATIGTVVYVVIEAPTQGWLAPVTLLSLLAGGLYALVFVGYELHVAAPMLDPRIFRRRTVTAATIVIGFQYFALLGLPFVYVQYVQYIHGYSTLKSGIAFFPAGPCLILAASAANRMLGRESLRLGGALGLALLAAGAAVLATSDVSSPYYLQPLLCMCLLGTGVGLSTGLATTAITEGLPSSQQGVASALNDTTREFGAALGIAVSGSVLNSAYRSSLDHSTALRGLSHTNAGLALNSIAAATQMGSGSVNRGLRGAVDSALGHGASVSSLVLAAVMVAGACAVLLIAPAKRGSAVTVVDMAIPSVPAFSEADRVVDSLS